MLRHAPEAERGRLALPSPSSRVLSRILFSENSDSLVADWNFGTTQSACTSSTTPNGQYSSRSRRQPLAVSNDCHAHAALAAVSGAFLFYSSSLHGVMIIRTLQSLHVRMTSARPYEIVVWGATGSVGKLVCEHVAQNYQVGMITDMSRSCFTCVTGRPYATLPPPMWFTSCRHRHLLCKYTDSGT